MNISNKIDDYGFLTLRPGQTSFDISSTISEINAGLEYRKDPNGDGHFSNLADVLDREGKVKKNIENIHRKSQTNEGLTFTKGLSASQPTLNKSYRKNRHSYKVRLALSSDIINRIGENGHHKTSKEIDVKPENPLDKQKITDSKKSSKKSWWKGIFSHKTNKAKDKAKPKLEQLRNSVQINSSIELIDDAPMQESRKLSKKTKKETDPVNPNTKKLIRFESDIIKPGENWGDKVNSKKRSASLDCVLNAKDEDLATISPLIKDLPHSPRSKHDPSFQTILTETSPIPISQERNYSENKQAFNVPSSKKFCGTLNSVEKVDEESSPQKSGNKSFGFLRRLSLQHKRSSKKVNEKSTNNRLKTNKNNNTSMSSIDQMYTVQPSQQKQRKILVHIHTRDEMPVENGIPQWKAPLKTPSISSNYNENTRNTFMESSFIGTLASTPKPHNSVINNKKGVHKNDKDDGKINSKALVHRNPSLDNKENQIPKVQKIKWNKIEPGSSNDFSHTKYFEVTSQSEDEPDGCPNKPENKTQNSEEEEPSDEVDSAINERTFAFTGVATDKIPDIIAKKHPYLTLTSSKPLRHMAKCLRQIQPEKINLENSNNSAILQSQISNRFISRRCYSDTDLSITPSPRKFSPLKELRSITRKLENESEITDKVMVEAKSLLTRSRSFRTDQLITRMRERIQRLEMLKDSSAPDHSVNIDDSKALEELIKTTSRGKLIQRSARTLSSPVMMSLPLPAIMQTSHIDNKRQTTSKCYLPSKERKTQRFLKLLNAELNKQKYKQTAVESLRCKTEQLHSTQQLARKARIKQLILPSCDKKIDTTLTINLNSASKLQKEIPSSLNNKYELSSSLSNLIDTASNHDNDDWNESETSSASAIDFKCVASQISDNEPSLRPPILETHFDNVVLPTEFQKEEEEEIEFETYDTNGLDHRNNINSVKNTVLEEMSKIKQKYNCRVQDRNIVPAENLVFHNSAIYSSASSTSSLDAYPGSESSSNSYYIKDDSHNLTLCEEYILSSDSTLCNTSDANSDVTLTNEELNSDIDQPRIQWHCDYNVYIEL